jgi:hypothetical protein
MIASIFIGTILSLMLSGCDNGPELSFPSELDAMCNEARYDAQACVQSTGFDPKIVKSIQVVEYRGEKWYPNSQCWAWWSADLNMYVSGLYWRDRIEIGRNPNLEDSNHQVNYANLKHEFGHYWLYPNGVPNHDPRFRSCFVRWNDVSAMMNKASTIDLVDWIPAE